MTRRRSWVRAPHRPPQLFTPVTLDRTPIRRGAVSVAALLTDFVPALVFAAFAGYNPFVIADLPSWMDAQFLRTASGTLIVLAILLALVFMFVVRSVGTRIVALVVLGAAIFGLAHYRQTLERCDKIGCECKLLGESVQGGNCSQG
jgi:hypothetical protein